MGKLVKRLKREAAANPKKAAILGIVTVVALYFWAPLLLGMVKKAGPGEPPSTAAVVPDAPAGQVVPAAKTEPDAALPPWELVVQWMQSDPRVKPAPALQLAFDPFGLVKPEPKAAEVEQAQPAAAQSIAPEALGLVLTSTIIGPNSRVAQIGGKPYAVGQMIEVPKDKAPVPTAFKLIDVQSHSAVLQLGTQRFELTIPRPGDSERIEIKGLSPNTSPLPLAEGSGVRASENTQNTRTFQRNGPHPSPLPRGEGTYGIGPK